MKIIIRSILLFLILQLFSLDTMAQNRYALGKKVSKYKLDSIIYIFTDMPKYNWGKVFSYDSVGNYKSITSFGIDSLGVWRKGDKEIFEYNSFKKITKDYEYFWVDSISNWVASRIIENTYDDDGQKIATLQYDWDYRYKKLLPAYKSKYIIFDKGKKILSYDSSWNNLTENWDYPYKHEYYYDDKGRSKAFHQFQFRSTDSAWVSNSKYEYTYDNKGNLLNWTDYRPDTSMNWFKANEEEFVYDIHNNLLYDISYLYFRFSSGPSSQTDNKYNQSNNLVESINYFRNSMTLHLDINRKLNYFYNDNISNSDIILPNESEIKSSKTMLTNNIIYNFEDSIWKPYQNSYYRYSTGDFYELLEIEKTAINIYPNPTSGIINIASILTNIKGIHVFDMTGKLVYTLQNESNQSKVQLDLSHLNNGIYFIQTQTEDGQMSNSKVVLTVGF